MRLAPAREGEHEPGRRHEGDAEAPRERLGAEGVSRADQTERRHASYFDVSNVTCLCDKLYTLTHVDAR